MHLSKIVVFVSIWDMNLKSAIHHGHKPFWFSLHFMSKINPTKLQTRFMPGNKQFDLSANELLNTYNRLEPIEHRDTFEVSKTDHKYKQIDNKFFCSIYGWCISYLTQLTPGAICNG